MTGTPAAATFRTAYSRFPGTLPAARVPPAIIPANVSPILKKEFCPFHRALSVNVSPDSQIPVDGLSTFWTPSNVLLSS